MEEDIKRMCWIPEEEQKLFNEMEKEWYQMLLGAIPIPEQEPLHEKFIFVQCSAPYYTCMERQSDKQIFEMSEMGKPDLTKPLDRKYFERYSRGMDI